MKSNDSIKQVALFFKERNEPVHITLESGRWFNGMIKEVYEDRLILNEDLYGEMLVLFERIAEDGVDKRGEKRDKKIR